jgi:hypothetical protein
MSNRSRTNPVPLIVVAGLILVVEALALRKGGTFGIVGVGALSGLAVLTLIVRWDAQRAAMGAALLACFTLTWNGWYVGPVRPGDVLVLFALVLFLIAQPDRHVYMPPWWIKQLAFAIIIVAVLHIFIPTNPHYLEGRTVITASGKATVSTKGSITSADLGVAIKYLIASFAIPVIFTFAAAHDRRAPRWLAMTFTVGAAASGWAAVAGKVGLGIITRLVTHIPVGTGRQFGFAFHPNFLAAGLTICIPLAMWMVFSENGRDRLWGYVSLPGLVLGVWASGSRGGAIAAGITLVVSVVLLPRARRYAPIILLSIVGLVGVTFAVLPSIGLKILKATRLVGGGASTSGSDTARSIVAHQGILDFLHSPIDGIGLQVATEAQNVYLQELASGGLILFLGMQIYLIAGIYYSARLIPRHDLGAAFVAVGIAIASLNVFEADLTDRFYYVPAAILVSLLYVDRVEDEDAAEMRALEVETAAAAARRARRAQPGRR